MHQRKMSVLELSKEKVGESRLTHALLPQEGTKLEFFCGECLLHNLTWSFTEEVSDF